MSTLLLINILLLFSMQSCRSLTNRPIIGILVQDLPTSPVKYESPLDVTGTTFLAAEYVKWVESAGARVIPILANSTEESLKKIFSYINGVLLPGGGASYETSSYRKNAEIIYKLAIEAHDNGDYFPIWGTCLGLQMLCVITSETTDVIYFDGTGTFDQSKTQRFLSQAFASRMLSRAPPLALDILQLESVAWMAHLNCVLADSFRTNEKLESFFDVLTVNKDDRSGKIYASLIEGKKYPFYGIQWHPEMNTFGFSGYGDLNINHSQDANSISHYLADFFVSESRKNNHHFPNAETERKYLIFNYSPFYSGLYGWEHTQIYTF